MSHQQSRLLVSIYNKNNPEGVSVASLQSVSFSSFSTSKNSWKVERTKSNLPIIIAPAWFHDPIGQRFEFEIPCAWKSLFFRQSASKMFLVDVAQLPIGLIQALQSGFRQMKTFVCFSKNITKTFGITIEYRIDVMTE